MITMRYGRPDAKHETASPGRLVIRVRHGTRLMTEHLAALKRDFHLNGVRFTAARKDEPH
jgi:hypothetical protein